MKKLIVNGFSTLAMLALFTMTVWPASLLFSFAATGEWLFWQAFALAGAIAWMLTAYAWMAQIGAAMKSLDGE